jgi:hypothetical protein
MRDRLLKVVSLSLTLVACLAAPRGAQAQRVTFAEPEVKAVFLFNFAQFVQWPDTAFPDPRSAFVIGILGNDPFGRILDDVIKGEVVQGRRFVVERFRRPEDIAICHILFVGEFAPEQYAHIFETMEGRPILTVGDSDAFEARGGVIRFVTDRNRIRLRVNVDAAKAVSLTISSNVLRSADIVGMGR